MAAKALGAVPRVAFFPRKGGFLFSERWLRQNGRPAFFSRIMHPWSDPVKFKKGMAFSIGYYKLLHELEKMRSVVEKT